MPQITIKNYINGQWLEEKGSPAVPLYNPSTGEQISEVPQSGPETSKLAVDTAAAAYPGWRRLSIGKRVAFIYAMREAMLRRKEDLAQAIALDQAKHISEARGEVQRVVEILEAALTHVKHKRKSKR